MKCPKCGYLGFEPVDRCRNCGYDFSLTRPLVLSELPIRTETPVAPLDDLTLVDAWSDRQPRPEADASVDFDADLARALDRPHEATSRRGGLPWSASGELPLFAPSTADDAPAVRPKSAMSPRASEPSEPSSPLSVRRGVPSPGRVSAAAGGARDHAAPLGLSLEADSHASDRSPGPASFAPNRREPKAREQDRARFSSHQRADWSLVDREPESESSAPDLPSSSSRDAGLGARFVAVAIDLSLLAVVDVVVIYFTLAICGLSLAEIGLLPIGPLLAFLLGQNLGYLVVFNAGGQTIGKMTTGIKVVAEETGSSMSLGHAVLRTVIWFVLAVPAGLGFLTALVSHDHRGLHDRFAGTRVVRVSA